MWSRDILDSLPLSARSTPTSLPARKVAPALNKAQYDVRDGTGFNLSSYAPL